MLTAREIANLTSLVRYAVHFGYLTQVEVDRTRECHPGMAPCLALHVLYRDKRFKDFGRDEFGETALFGRAQFYSGRKLEKVHLRLAQEGYAGYHLVAPTRRRTKPSLEYLTSHRALGRFVPDYFAWLDGAGQGIKDQNLAALRVLADYIDDVGLPNLVEFRYGRYVS